MGQCTDQLGSSSNSYFGDDSQCDCNPGLFDISADAYRRFTYRSYVSGGAANANLKSWLDESPNANDATTGTVKTTSGTKLKASAACSNGNGASANICFVQGGVRTKTDYDMVSFNAASLPPNSFTICSVTRYTTTSAVYQNRIVTDVEQKRFVTLVGDRYRDLVLKHGERLNKMDHDAAKDKLGKLSAQARDRAERQAISQ